MTYNIHKPSDHWRQRSGQARTKRSLASQEVQCLHAKLSPGRRRRADQATPLAHPYCTCYSQVGGPGCQALQASMLRQGGEPDQGAHLDHSSPCALLMDLKHCLKQCASPWAQFSEAVSKRFRSFCCSCSFAAIIAMRL